MDEGSYRLCARIHLDAVRKNMEMMKGKLKAGTKILAVVKTDAYGHGAWQIARILQTDSVIWGFAVATVPEARALLEGCIHKPVLVLGTVFPQDYEEVLEKEIRIPLFEKESAKALSDLAVRKGKKALVHLAVDTGMSRIGLNASREGILDAIQMASLPGLETEGIFTHFARADEADKSNAIQALERFTAFTAGLEKAGISLKLKHCSNSAGILELPQANLDMVRAGITLYGIYPSDEMRRDISPLVPVMELKSHVSFVKEVPAGTAVSYGGTYVTDETKRIATIPAGYGDGYPRSLSNKGYVLIHGKKAPILGRVCMDQFMVDVTGMEDVKVGCGVTLMGEDHGAEITVDELSALSGRFPYEFVCCIGKRVPRVFLDEVQG